MVGESKKTALFAESTLESTSACLVTMVQGNVVALTVAHLGVALETGLIAGAAATTLSLFSGHLSRRLGAIVLGMATTIADFFIHSGPFWAVAAEAVVTGSVASLLWFLVTLLLRRRSSDTIRVDSS